MNPGNIPRAERLRAGERVKQFARYAGDCIVRGLPCVGYGAPIETEYHRNRELARQTVSQLERYANEPPVQPAGN